MENAEYVFSPSDSAQQHYYYDAFNCKEYVETLRARLTQKIVLDCVMYHISQHRSSSNTPENLNTTTIL